MQLSILAIGKMKSGPETQLLTRYLERAQKAGKQLGLSGPSVSQWNESRASSSLLRKSEESENLAKSIMPGALIFCLDERGKDLSSVEFAAILQNSLDNSVSQCAFAIGGPDGHFDDFRERANHVISFGKMTWPHQLARVMLAEQIYRAITILSKHPYHRD